MNGKDLSIPREKKQSKTKKKKINLETKVTGLYSAAAKMHQHDYNLCVSETTGKTASSSKQEIIKDSRKRPGF